MWIQGTILNVCGSILVNLAANLLKLAHNVEESDKISPNKQEITTGLNEALKYGALLQCCTISFGSPVYASKLYWRLGAFLFAAGSVINFLSLSMAAQSLLATLGGVQFVSNIFFAKCILGEKVTRKGLIATLVIILGLTIAVSFSDHASTRYSSSSLIALYDTKYITFIVSVAATLIISECTYLVYTASEKAGKPLYFSSIIRPVTYSMVSATIGTQSVLQSKCLAELLRTDITGAGKGIGNDLFANTLFYIVLTAFLLGMTFWLYRLNNALKLFDGLVIIPIIQVFWVTSAILQGGMFFKEFEEMKGHQSLLFLTGVTIVFFGVYLIATSQSNESDLTSPEAPAVVLDDKIRDPERGEVELQRKRSDNNVMIITCIGSPFKCEKKRVGSKKHIKNNNNNNSNNNSNNDSNCSSSSSSSDDCDRYYEDLMPVRAALEALEGGEGLSSKQESEGRVSSKRSKDTSENCSLLPPSTTRGAAVYNQSTAASLNPMHIQSAQSVSPPAPSGALSTLSALLSPLGFTSRDDLAPSLFGSASTSFKSRESKVENTGVSPKELLSRADATAFSPPPRSDVRAPAVHLRERSMSSCGLLELIVDEGDDEI